MPLKRSEPALAQCKATSSSGQRCGAEPHKDGLCFFHSEPQKAAELRRKGGRSDRRTFESPVAHITAPGSAGDVKRMLAESMAEVPTGKMDPKLGTTLAYIGTSLLKAIELADIDDRLMKLELTTGLEDPTETVSTGDSASRQWEQAL